MKLTRNKYICQFRLVRLLRTSASDQFVIFKDAVRLCHVHVHYATAIHLDILLDGKFPRKLVDSIIRFVEDTVDIADAEDLLMTVYIVREVFSSSREKDWSLEPATTAQLKEVSLALSKQLCRYANATGRIIEDLTIQYFNEMGYDCIRGTSEDDANKVDLIATKDGQNTLIQCKSGSLSYKSLLSYCDKMISYPKYANDGKSICFVQKSFPKEFIFGVSELSKRFGCDIIKINVHDLLKMFPEASQSIG